MPPKRKAGNDLKGTAKKGRSSAASTPASSTPATAINSDDDYSDAEPTEGVQRLLSKVDQYEHAMGDLNLDSITVTRPRGKQHHDMVTSLFTRRGKSNDYSYLTLKPDHETRPLYIDPRRAVVLLESFHPLAKQAQDFLITIAEPKSRPQFIHEYKITQHSLYAAVSVGLRPDDIINTLDRFLKTPIPEEVLTFIRKFTDRFGKVKLVLKNAQYFIESTDIKILQALLKNPDIAKHRIQGGITSGKAQTTGGIVIPGTQNAAGVKQASLGQSVPNNNEGEQPAPQDEAPMPNVTDEDDEEDEETVFSFQVPDLAVENVLSACLGMGYPVLEEYDFRKDDVNANLDIDLRPNTQIRYYQEKSLSKMFGNGRAKSGIIVLPCGAGKTLVGITAACTIKKGVIVLCTGSMSAVQWRQEFLKWSNIKPEDITLFTSDSKNKFAGNTGIIVTTYSMITQSRERAHDAKKMMDFLGSREWGLMLLDEVHVVPANTFRTVISCIKTHSKLGLTATLLREDDKIAELNFLIGPKLYEANWMELSQQGHIARVQCAEVWCPMSPEFYEEYLASRGNIRKQQHLYAMNPNKFQACQYLIHYHEKRGDKLIVFSDDVVALKKYATGLVKPFICGETPQSERMLVLENFQHNPEINTLFLSKVGDTSLDLPEATCLIQISSQYGSRRQEAQRLGRILRAKRRNDVGFNAFFYSLVSKDTDEVFYSSKRQAFLVDQGYAFKVITELHNLKSTPGLQFSTAAERRELLQECILKTSAADFNSVEKTDDLFHSTKRKRGGAKPGVRRTAGGLFELSGGQDMAYSEQNRGKVALKKKKPESSAFFKKMDREKDRRKAILAEEDIPKPAYGQPKGKGRGRY